MIRPHYVPLYQSICTSEKLADLKDGEARFFYVCLLTHMDSWGRCAGSARVLTAKVWPMLGKKPADTEKALADLERVGLIVRYEVGGEQFLTIPDWEEKAGRVGKLDRRGPSLCPEPPPPVSRTSPASGQSVQDYSCLARAGESEPSRAEREPSRERTEPKAPPGAVIPPTLDTPEFQAVWAEWLSYRKERKDPITPTGGKAQLAKCARMGVERSIAALQHTMESGWLGMREPDAPTGTVQKGPSKGQPDGRAWLNSMLGTNPNQPVRETTATVVP